MKVNDILVSKWGYEQTNVDFYKILKVTKATVIVQELEKIEKNDDMSGLAMPIDKVKGQPFRRKIHIFNNEKYIHIDNNCLAEKWKYTPERFTNYA